MQKILFKTETYCFYAELNNSATAQNVARCLPLRSKTEFNDSLIGLKVNCQASCANDFDLDLNAGDLTYSCQNGYLAIILAKPDMQKSEKENLPCLSAVIIGKTAASLEEIKQIKFDNEVDISLVKEKKNQDTRILSQSEIDNLVQGLLKEKS